MTAFAAAQPQEAMGQDAALEEGVELSLDPKNSSYPGAASVGGGVGRPICPTSDVGLLLSRRVSTWELRISKADEP
ncbi:MAG: hypothetical protein ACK5X1_14970 [Betaproteobacteria bacterium]